MKNWTTSVSVTIALLGAATMAGAVEYGWDGGGDGTNWSSGNNWSPNAPVGGPGAADIVHHKTVSQTANITVDKDVTIANARVKWDGLQSAGNSSWTANWTDDGAGRTVNVTQSLEVMHGHSATTYQHINATLKLSNLHLALGSKSQRADLEVGRRTSTSSGGNAYSLGTLTVSGGSVIAYLDHFVIGRNLGNMGGAGGTVNLSNCTNVTIDLAGTAHVGAYAVSGQGSYNVGTFSSGGGSVNVSGNLVLADSRNEALNGNGSDGKLYLSNTTFTVGGQALFYGRDIHSSRPTGNTWERRYAQVFATATGRSSGLDLANTSSAALSFANLNKSGLNFNLIDVKFTADPTETDAGHWYWGMRWKGDHETALQTYRGETYPRLKLDVSGLSDAVKRRHLRYLKQRWPGTYGSYTGIGDLQPNDYIVFDDGALGGTGYTYVGVCVPPPSGTVFMLR